MVESRVRPRRRAQRPVRGGGGVRVSGVGVRHAIVRVPRGRPDVRDLRRRRTNVVRGSRSRVTDTRGARARLRRPVELTLGCGGRRHGVVSRGNGDDSERAGAARRFDRIDGDALAELARAGRSFALLGAASDRVPNGGRPDGACPLLLAFEPGAPRSGRRAASVDRDEPWRADEQRDPDLQPRAPVLDEPRLRRRRCELRRVHGIRTRIP